MRATTSWWTDLARDLRDELAGLRVAVYGSGGSPYHHAALAASWGALPVALSADAIRRGTLSDVDVIVFPGGGARAMAGMLDPLGVEGAAAIREWVAAGGMYVGSCAGSFLPAIVGDAYWGAHPESRELHMVCARLANGSDSEWEGLTSPGVGALDMEVTRPGHWLARDLPERFRLVHYNGPMFLPQGPTGGDARLGSVDGVARFVSRTPRFTPSEAFMAEDPSSVAAQVFDRGVAAGASTAIAAPYGEGVVVLYGSHPEFGFDAIQLGWGEGVRLFANALRHQAGRRSARAPIRVEGDETAARRSLGDAAERLGRLAGRFERLAESPAPEWVRPGCVPGFLGRSPTELWRDASADAARAARATAGYLSRLAGGEGTGVAAAGAWLDEVPPTGQDYGFMGLEQLVSAMEAGLDRGEAAIRAGGVACMEHAYAGLDAHPYHLIAASYLSAAGLSACAACSASVIGAYADLTDGAPVGPTADPIALPDTSHDETENAPRRRDR
jgi:hypothetical protein